MEPSVIPEVFVCYAREDATRVAPLFAALKPYERNQILSVFVDDGMKPGMEWDPTIQASLERASVAVMLVSRGWLASEYVAAREVPRLFERADAGTLTLHWLKLDPFDIDPDALPRWRGAPVPLTDIQWIGYGARTIGELRGANLSAAWTAAAQVLKRSAVARPYIERALPRLGAHTSEELARRARAVGGRPPPRCGVPARDLVALAEALLDPPDDRAKIEAFVSAISAEAGAARVLATPDATPPASASPEPTPTKGSGALAERLWAWSQATPPPMSASAAAEPTRARSDATKRASGVPDSIPLASAVPPNPASGAGPSAPLGGLATPGPAARRLGRWSLGEVLGEGGYGTVYAAVDDTGAIAAVKVLKPGATDAETDDRRRRFARGPEALARLAKPAHPNIVALIEGPFQDEGVSWYAMERVAGPSLRKLGRNRLIARPLDERLGWFRQVLAAVQHAHDRPEGAIHHRDLTPENILLDTTREPWSALVCDFDLARDETAVSMTRTMGLVGKTLYVPQEQLGSAWEGGEHYVWTRPPEHVRDLWALGMLLHFLVCGYENASAKMRRKQRAATGPVVAEIEALIEWMLAEDPEERPQSVGEVLARLGAGERRDGEVVGALREPVAASRPPRPAAIAVAVAISEEGHAGLFRTLEQVKSTTTRRGAGLRPSIGSTTAPGRAGPRLLPLVEIPAGTFEMGSPEGVGDNDERPRHRVTLSIPLAVGVTPVTQAQWAEVAKGSDLPPAPSLFKGAEHPVERVSWVEAARWCNALSAREGRAPAYTFGPGDAVTVELRAGYRLPTEAEWEHFARAGTTTRWSFGDEEAQLPEHAWFRNNAGDTTHPVGTRRLNPWGLHDVYGNVWEWCSDQSKRDYTNRPEQDPFLPPAPGGRRVVRGGSWDTAAWGCRSGYRGKTHPDGRDVFLGFRVVLPLLRGA